VRRFILEGAISKLVALKDLRRILFNNKSEFVNGGFNNDTGVSGRKVISDTYCGLAPHGGGALSGKDPSKVDRSATYMARFVAKNVVANGMAKSCLVAVAYAFGEETPVMLAVETEDSTRDSLVAELPPV
jgi:S-adenosylmethionine synthetase